MTDHEASTVWEMIGKIPICMLATWDGSGLHSRPMAAYPRPGEDVIYFLTDMRRHKDDEILQYPKICAAFVEAGAQKFVSISGTAEISNDRATIRELWSVAAKAWWDSPDDPNIRLIKLMPEDAEYLDTPGKIVSSIKMAVAAVSNMRPNMGKNRKVAM